jgi:hypothetical protein
MRKSTTAAVNHTERCVSKIIIRAAAIDISHVNILGVVIIPYLLPKADARIPYNNPREIEDGKNLLAGPTNHPFSCPMTGTNRSGNKKLATMVIL